MINPVALLIVALGAVIGYLLGSVAVGLLVGLVIVAVGTFAPRP